MKSQIKRIIFENNGIKYELYIDWSIKDNLTLEVREDLPIPDFPDEIDLIFDKDIDLK